VTVSKELIVYDLKEYLHDLFKGETEEKPKEEPKKIYSIKDNDIPDAIDKARSLRRWKQSFGCYSLDPNKFRFSLRDLK
jgi:hypothetical protein